MASAKSLTPAEAERVRAALRKYVDGLGYGGQSAAAKVLGIAQQRISALTRAVQPDDPGVYVARRVAALLGTSLDALLSGNPHAPSTTGTFAALPGWAEAVAEARKRWPYYPPEAWEGAGRISGFDMESRPTPDLARKLAETWLEVQTARRDTPEDIARDAAREGHERLVTKPAALRGARPATAPVKAPPRSPRSK